METEQDKAAEQAALKVEKEEDVRARIITEYGFDENADADKERIDKLTVKEIESQKKLSSSIGQKIKYREEAKKLKDGGSTIVPPPKVDGESLTPQDTIALAKVDATEEDIDEIMSHAKYKKISVREALKTPYIKSYLSEQAEFRKTAAATNTGGSRRPAPKATDDVLLSNLSEGKIPEPGSKEAEDLFWAKNPGKRPK